jgi:AcrR family transcriptional regulator
MDSTAMPAEDWGTRRSDARRNHERVLAAAVEVFTELGLDATMPQVAARAGVGKATVYRSFPTKGDLVRALAQVHVDWLAERIRVASEAAVTDAYAALQAILEEVFSRLAEDRLMVKVLSGVEGLEEDVQSKERLEEIIRHGVEQGALREDVTSMDLHVLMAGVAHALLEMGIDDPALWRRYARFAIAAVRR